MFLYMSFIKGVTVSLSFMSYLIKIVICKIVAVNKHCMVNNNIIVN